MSDTRVYLGIHIMLTGIGLLFFSHLWFAVMLAFVPIWYPDGKVEERQMIELHGSAYFGSLVSRVTVTNTYKEIAYLSKSLHFGSRCLPEILSGYVSFYHELHEWTNDTNLFRFNIREIRLFVPFVIPTSPTHHRHNLSTRCFNANYQRAHISTTENEPGCLYRRYK